jgi:signal transduction histidine kinase
MNALQTIESSASSLARGPKRFLEKARKKTSTELRWPLVVVSCYLLLYSPQSPLAPNQIHAIVLFYLLANATLYFVAYGRLESPYFYGPLSLVDAALLTLGLSFGAASTPEFYLACLCTLILACICNDPRGLLAITLLAPALYGYVVFSSGSRDAATLYLRLSVPFAISLLHGYFAQIERLRRLASQTGELASRRQKAADELRTRRDRLDVLHGIKLALSSKNDLQSMLDAFLEKALAHLRYSAATIRLRDQASGTMQGGAMKGIRADNAELIAQVDKLAHTIVTNGGPLVIRDPMSDPRIEKADLFHEEGLSSFIGMPLSAGGEILGSLAFFAREQFDCGEEETEFVSNLASEAAVVVWQSRLLQQIQHQAGELRRANRVKDQLLGGVSHELRSPVNVISGYTNMLLERTLGEITPIQEKALQTIFRQATDLNAMINSVLQVSSIDAELVHPELHETNFWEFLYELKSDYDYPLAADVRLVWNLSSDLPTLMADRVKLRQILNNLISNAIKFTKRGTVTVSAHYLHGKRCMEFKVADTGIGISKEELPHIFEKFHQLAMSDDRSSGGVGLGLYIVKKFTAILQGTVQVESKPGKGSVFTLRIPCYPVKAKEAPPPLIAAAG